MTKEHVNHNTIATFADERVNLPRDVASEYRAQVNRLRDRLGTYLNEHPDFGLVKMLLSGSLAKGTALRTINDIDVAVYVKGSNAPSDVAELIRWLAEKLRMAFPNMSADQITPQTYSVTISFRGTGLDVDVVPVIYEGDPQGRGYLISQRDGSRLMTSIPMHLEFIRKRKQANNIHFAQTIRLVKYWARNKKSEIDGFRFKSFMIEMILSHLADNGMNFNDYTESLAGFFNYIVTDDFRSRIVFPDYYKANEVSIDSAPIEVVDPVNPANNVGLYYTKQEADLIVDEALAAGDAIDAALYATTKAETVRHWQKILGSSFGA